MTLEYSQSRTFSLLFLAHLIFVVLPGPVVTFSLQGRRQGQQFRRILWNDVVKRKAASSSRHQRLQPLMTLWKDETDRSSWTNNINTTNVRHLHHHVAIEYCTQRQWMLKSFWFTQELLSTFNKNDLLLDAVTVLPSLDTTEKFVVRLSEINNNHHNNSLEDNESVGSITVKDHLLWDRQHQKGFPVLKDLKQIVRDRINPDTYLGHSDTEARQQLRSHTQQPCDVKNNDSSANTKSLPPEETTIATPEISAMSPCKLNTDYISTPAVIIHYCTGCQWLLRAAYLGQELLTAFSEGEGERFVKSVTLVPSYPPEKGGRFVSTSLICK